MLHKRPIILVIAVTVLAVYYTANWLHQRRALEDQFARNIIWREQNMGQILSVAPLFADIEMTDLFVERLGEAQSRGYIDFFMLMRNGEIESY